MRRPLFVALALSLSFAASAQPPELPAWMAGSWKGESDGRTMEEQWSSPAGGLMLGFHRDVGANGKAFFEFLRIEARDGKLTYLAMPNGQPATPFPLKSSEESRIVFENLSHDFPQRIIYWREGEKLCARVEGAEGGPAPESWCWSRDR